MRYNSLNRIRLLLSFLVTWSHCYPLTGNNTLEPISRITNGTATGGSIAVYGFFFISGLLITESWIRCNDARIYIMSRILRIWPAFLIAIIVSALIAAYSSQLPLNEVIPSITKYITHNAKILTPIQYNMADAFSNNPFKNAVNGSLWTLPWEIRVYILTLILGFLGILSSRATANTFIFVGLIALYQIKRLGALPTGWDSESVIYMLACYLIGKFAATNRNCLGNTKILMAIFASYVLLRSFVPDSKVWCQILLISGAIYAIATHKFLAIKDTDIDLSYGVYIYSFPIQQLVAYLAPEITPTAMLLVAVPIILIAAAISWFIIEKPSMKLNCKIKKNLQKQEQPIATK